ncbi:MAG: M14 family metallopeptidase [Planctomycetota bacterium]
MKKKNFFLPIFLASLFLLCFMIVPAAYSGPMLKMVKIEAQSPGAVKKLARMGIDIAAVRKGPVVKNGQGIPMQTYHVEAVISARDEKQLGRENFSWTDVPGKGPVKKIGEPYEVYHSFDEPKTGIKAQLHKMAATYPHLCQLKTVGHSIQKRPMLAMRLTNEKIKSDKPQVLFVATHHAREWVATEMAMRLIKYLTSSYGSVARVTDLLNTVEVWVIPVGNPDGYQYTFTTERLWRKNLRDNDGDGETTIADGVDLNRNFAAHWGLDNEGSSPVWSSSTYRGTAPNSEPETQAVVKFIEKNDFKFVISYHTYGNLLLYPWGWQVQTPSLDDPIFVAQAGTDDNPAIWDSLFDPPRGYDPGVGADLYTTNGDFTDWAYYDLGIPAQTVEFTDGNDFRFPDDEDMVQTVFEDSLEFAMSVAESALDPAHPVSPVGIPTVDVYHTPVTISYGPNQMVEVMARKGLALSLSYSINGETGTTASFTEKLGTVYNDRSGTYYSRYVAIIGGPQVGDTVEYWFVGGTSGDLGPYSYSVMNATGNPILVVAAEDYTGPAPTYPPGGPHYLAYYTDALDDGGYAFDVWDVDVLGIPSYTEVLSHYDVAIWYTGDDYAAFVPLGLDTQEAEVMNFREFINYEDGKLLATGQDLAWYPVVFGGYTDDFFQYYLGALMHTEEGGMDPVSALPFDVVGEPGDLFDGLSFTIHGETGADNQGYADTFLATSHFLPHLDGLVAARYDRPGSPFDPHSGDYYVYSQMADRAYKRLGGTFTLPAGSPTLKFWISYDIEADWDYAFVEISEAGSGVWTTLEDQKGLTTTDTGLSCTSSGSWVDQIHPFLAHYMTYFEGPPPSCISTGSTGSWNGFTGNSGGWQQVLMDLSAYAGMTVELYISYASDWAVQNLGVFVDDIELSGYLLENFEGGLGDWAVSIAPGSGAFNNWERTTAAGFPEGPAIRTDNSVYLGFGFEAIDTADNRNAVMQAVMEHFGQ